MDTVIIAGGTTLPSTSTTNYAYVQGNLLTWASTDAAIRNVIPFAGTIKSFYANVETAPGTGGSGKQWAFTLVKNGTDTGVTCTILETATDAHDTTNTVSVSAGDTLSIKCVPTSTPASATDVRFSILFSGNANESIILGSTRATTLATGATEYHGLQECAGGNATLSNKAQVMPTAGTISNLYVELDGTPGGSATYAFTVLLNGSTQTLTCTVASGATTANDTTHSFAVVAGDLVAIQSVPSSSPTARVARWGVKWAPTTDGEGVILHSSGSNPNTAGATRYLPITGTSQSWTSTEASTTCLFNACTLQKFYVDLVTAPGGSGSYTFRSRKNTANGNLSVAISAAATTGNDTSNTDTIAAADKVTISEVSASTPASTVARWGVVAYIAPPATATAHNLSLLGVGA